MNLREEMPEILKIHDPELRIAVKTLVNASDTLRQLLIKALDDKSSKMDIMSEYADVMLIADKVVSRWLLEFEEDNDPSGLFSIN